MSDWSDTQWFTAGDVGAVVSNTTPVADAGETDATTNIWSSSSGTSSSTSSYTEEAETSDTGGSGVVPAIAVITDYWLRDETGEIIEDMNGEGISLRGLTNG